EPHLLPRLLSGEKFNTKSIAQLNRVQPKVAITAIEQEKENPELCTVKVNVAKATGAYGLGKQKTRHQTDAYDVRLFRDGQIVAQYPQEKSQSGPTQSTLSDGKRLQDWRDGARVKPGEAAKLEADGSLTITFKNIKLPSKTANNQVEFTAYAFNEDRVNSQT